MQLGILAHDVHVNQPANSHRVYPSKITHDKTSAMRIVFTSYIQTVVLLQPHKFHGVLLQFIPFVHSFLCNYIQIIFIVILLS